MTFLFSHSVGTVIIPTDVHIVRGIESTNQYSIAYVFTYIYIYIGGLDGGLSDIVYINMFMEYCDCSSGT